MTYSYIYIIGTGKVAKECQKIANDFFRQEVNFVKNIENLDDFFKNLKNCLIISANNFYIFKKECVGGKIKCRKRKIKCRIFATNYLSFNLKLKL